MTRKPKRPPLGRPPRAGSTAKPVTIKATDDERARWQLAADRESQSLSQWLRAAAELAVARGSTR